MVYKSNRPTKQKERLFYFMEKHKQHGTISMEKLGRYVVNKSYRVNRARGLPNAFHIINRRGSILASVIANKQKKINHWLIN